MNILVAYFSYTGHTRGIAQQICEQIGGTLFEIKPAEAYSEDYETTERQGRKETSDGYRPPLFEKPINLESYDAVLLGSPNWFNTIAPPVATLLAECELSDKKIALFCTNGGGGLGHMENDIKKLCGNAEMLKSINIYEDGGSEAKEKIAKWLCDIGLKK